MANPLVPKSSDRPVQLADQIEGERLTDLVLPISDLFDPDLCPAELLPWLAWHEGVDVWSDEWSTSTRRAVIKDYKRRAKERGTKSGVINALGPLASEVTIENWYEYGGAPGTFRVTVIGSETQTSAANQSAIEQTIEQTKPYTRTFTIVVDVLAEIELLVGIGARFNVPVTIISEVDTVAGGGVLPIENIDFFARFAASTGVTAIGGQVTAWQDISGNARHLGPTPGVAGPGTGTVGGHSVVVLDADSGLQTADLGALPTAMTVVAIMASSRRLSILHEGMTQHRSGSGRLEYIRSQFAEEEPAFDGSLSTIIAYNDGAQSTMKRDGVVVAQTPSSQIAATKISLGRNDSGPGAPSEIAEILILPNPPTAQDEASINAYVREVYG